MSTLAKNMTCFRLPAEVRAAVDQFCAANGMGISEFYRWLTDQAIAGAVDSSGYQQARSLAITMVNQVIAHALESIPATYEEYLARFGLVGAGPRAAPDAG